MRLMPLLVLLAGCGTTWTPVDYDGDGFSPADGDCWDTDKLIYPGAEEIAYDGIDQDCSEAQAGNTYTDEQAHDLDYDQDGDGHVPTEYEAVVTTLPADDCDDDPTTGPTVYPGAADTWYDGVDSDCAGDNDFDQDGDGHASATSGGGDDCFDAIDDAFVNDGGLDPAEVYPGVEEDVWYDGTDADCAGDDDFDQDGDTYTVDVDCDDLDPERYPDPSIPEIWYNGVDENCDFNDGDQDGDLYYKAGYAFAIPDGFLADDCFDDPADAAAWGSLAPEDVSPGAAETWYDTFDQDCAGGDDFDQDADGERALDHAAGADCDDTNAAINSSATETWYDNVDQNCDGLNDNDQDQDGSDFGADCDDTDATRSPDYTEDCATTYDDDCDLDTNTPNGIGAETFYTDTDGDGHGSTDSAELCVAQAPYTLSTSDDCDDTDAAVNPDADEDCATRYDDDCDGQTNEIGADNCISWYPDADGDDYGTGTARCQCDATTYYPTDVAGDCDDTEDAINPGETEVCNNIDDDCVGGADDGLTLFYADADDDSFGDETDSGDCATIGVEDNTDCDDGSSATYPGAPEMCDGVENDCDPTSVWAAGDEDGLVASVTDDDGTWTDLSTSFDDAVASVYTVAAGRTYYFCAGTYNTRLSISGITVDLIGVYGADNTILDSSTSTAAKETINTNGGDVALEGLTITGGSGAGTSPNQFGGGVFATASSASAPTLTLTDCIIDGNTADYGGGLSVYSYAWVVLDGTTISNNTADSHGGGAHVSTTGMLEATNGSFIEDNIAAGNGGGIYAAGSGDIEVDASTIRQNLTTGSGDGGGVYVVDGTLALTSGALVISNEAADDAGGIFIDDGVVTCTNSGIYLNEGGRGAVYLSNYTSTTAAFTASDCDFGTGGLDNTDYDVTVKASASSYADYTGYTAGESFTCTWSSDTCTPTP